MKFDITGRLSVHLDWAAEEEFIASSLRFVKIGYTRCLLNRLECSFITIDAITELVYLSDRYLGSFNQRQLERNKVAASGFALARFQLKAY